MNKSSKKTQRPKVAKTQSKKVTKPQSKVSPNSRLSLLWRCGNSVLVPTIVVLVCVALALTQFPNSERMVEYLNFFVWTPEHLSLRLSMYPGLNSMLTAWLLQFFKSAVVGVVLEAGLLALMTWLAAMVGKAWGRRSWAVVALIPAVGMACLFLHKPSVTLEGIFFFGSLVAVGYASRRCRWWVTSLVITAVGLLSFWFIAFPVTVLLMVLLAVLAVAGVNGQRTTVNGLRRAVNCVLPLVFIGITAVSIKLSSDHLGFIPFTNRWWFVPEVREYVTELLLLLAAPVVLMFVPRVGKASVQAVVSIVACIAAGVWCYSHIADNEGYQVSETVYRYAALAEAGEWQQLRDEVNSNESIDNNIYLQYGLLAEARLGTLPDNLFLYPINSPELFCPRLENQPPASEFSRVFYRELGFLDEAFHQAFQFGMMASPSCGFCAGSLRHMAEYSVAMGDKPLAEKYLWLLERTSNNGDFVAEQRAKLDKTVGQDSGVPHRGGCFTMAFAFNTEMVQHVENDRDNKAALDYLLCGLLLTKRLEVFRIILNEYADKYKDAPLPRAYAEAAAVLRLVNPSGLSPELHYDPAIDERLKEFNKAHAAQNDASFRGTFWYYYFYAQIPPQQEWISQSQSS